MQYALGNACFVAWTWHDLAGFGQLLLPTRRLHACSCLSSEGSPERHNPLQLAQSGRAHSMACPSQAVASVRTYSSRISRNAVAFHVAQSGCGVGEMAVAASARQPSSAWSNSAKCSQSHSRLISTYVRRWQRASKGVCTDGQAGIIARQRMRTVSNDD